MNDNERRRYEMLVRVNQFGIDNAADFPIATIGGEKFNLLGGAISKIDGSSADQQAGYAESKQQFEIKDTRREDLRDLMSAISRTARSMEYDIDGIADKFRFIRNQPDEILLAKGSAFLAEATPYEDDFIAYGLPADFLTDLGTAIDNFSASFNATASATAEHVEATANNSANIREGMILVRTLEAIVKNKYANNPGKLAAWTSASHVEKAPKKATPPSPPPTP